MALKIEKLSLHDFVRDMDSLHYTREIKTVLSGEILKMGQVCKSNSAGKKQAIAATGDEVHRYDPNTAPTGGTFKLRVMHKDRYWVETAPIAYNASNTAIATALNLVLGASAVSVTGTAATQIDVTFDGTGYTNNSWPLGSMDIALLQGVTSCSVTRYTSAGAAQDEVQTVAIGGTLTGGTYKLGLPTVDGSWTFTDDIAYNANATSVQTAIDNVLGGSSKIAASGTWPTAGVLTFSGTGYAGLGWPICQIDAGSCTGATTADVTRTTPGGYAGNAEGNRADSIALEAIDASAGDKTGLFLVRGPTVVNASQLIYGGGDPAACLEALKLVGIVGRDEPSLQEV